MKFLDVNVLTSFLPYHFQTNEYVSQFKYEPDFLFQRRDSRVKQNHFISSLGRDYISLRVYLFCVTSDHDE
jgi:hypothetical protein